MSRDVWYDNCLQKWVETIPCSCDHGYAGIEATLVRGVMEVDGVIFTPKALIQRTTITRSKHVRTAKVD